MNQSLPVFAEPSPAFDFTLNQTCTPVEVTLNNLSTNSSSYFWDFGNGETSTETNPIVIYSVGDEYSIQLTSINGVCARTTNLPLTIHQTPEPITALSDQDGCAPFPINFEAIVNGEDLSYNWDFDDGLSSFEQNVNHVFQEPGVYQVSLVVESPFCKDSIIEEVIIHEPIDVNVTTLDILCNSAATGAIDLEMIGGTAPYQYNWSNAVVEEDQNSLMAGVYEVTIVDANNCFWLDSMILSEPLPILATVVDSSIVSCFGGDDGGLCINVTGGVSDYTINWENQVIGNCIENVVAGNYNVTIVDGNDCVGEDLFEVIQNPEIAIIDTLANISCFGANDGYIHLDSILGGVSDFYNTNLDGPITYDGGAFFPNLTSGNYNLTVQDLEGCTLEKSFTISEPDSIWLNIPVDSVFIGMGDSIMIRTNHNIDMPDVFWTPEIGLDCPTCEDPFAAPLKTTTYYLSLMDQNACEVKDTITVVVDANRNFYIPNTFTPNGDGRNDVFRIRSRLASIDEVTVFRVFDRWCEMVFESTNFRPQNEALENAWDGTFKGKLLTPDVFTFYAEIQYLDKEKELVEGTVTLIR